MANEPHVYADLGLERPWWDGMNRYHLEALLEEVGVAPRVAELVVDRRHTLAGHQRLLRELGPVPLVPCD